MEWHAKLGEARLREMKATRSVERMEGRVRHLEEVLAESERAFGKLERDLVQVTKVHVHVQCTVLCAHTCMYMYMCALHCEYMACT